MWQQLRSIVIAYLITVSLFAAWAVWSNRPTVLFINQITDPVTHQVKYQVCGFVHRWGTKRVCPNAGVEFSQAQYTYLMTQEYVRTQGAWKALP